VYTLLGGGVRHSSTDSFAFNRKISSADDDSLIMMLEAAKSQSGWSLIEDGETYTESGTDQVFG